MFRTEHNIWAKSYAHSSSNQCVTAIHQDHLLIYDLLSAIGRLKTGQRRVCVNLSGWYNKYISLLAALLWHYRSVFLNITLVKLIHAYGFLTQLYLIQSHSKRSSWYKIHSIEFQRPYLLELLFSTSQWLSSTKLGITFLDLETKRMFCASLRSCTQGIRLNSS